MTVETTSFLASSKIASNGSEKSAKILKTNKNLVIFLLATILLVFCLLASFLQIWIFHRMNDMQKEIDSLRINIRDMENNELEDREILKEISEFNRKYNNHNQNGIKDDIDMDENINSPDEKIKFDDVGDDDVEEDDYGSEDSEENEDETYNGFHSGYGEDYDAEEEYSNEDEINDSPKSEDENNIYKDMEKHTRRTRSIAGITHQGVPIVDEPYALRRNRTRTSNDANDPKLKLTWNGHSRSNSRREHNERNRQQHNSMRHHHSNRFAFAAAPVHHSYESYGQRFNSTPTEQTPPSIPMQSRQSRVMHFEDKTKAFRQVVGKDQLAKLQEQRMAPEHYIRHNAGIAARKPMRKNLELRNAKRMKITAVHFDGDSSKLEETSHYSYKGNKRVELNKDQYMHWKPADWVYSHGMAKYFHMDTGGTLTVNDHGLFLIYAQVLYHDSHDLNGYVIEHNGDEHYKCITMTHTGTRGEKTNSCYTSGLIHLRNGDKVRLRDLGNHRNVLMDKEKSYFGLIKINLFPSVSSAESTEIMGRAAVK